MRYVGLDVHKTFAFVVELLEDESVKEYRVDLDSEGLRVLKNNLGPDAHVVMEASTSTFRLYDELVDHAGEIVVAHPAQTRGASALHVKTDRGDAHALARLRRAGFIRSVWIPGRELRALRNLTEYRLMLSQLRQAAGTRVKSLLAQEMLTAPVAVLTGPRGRQFLDSLKFEEAGLGVYLESGRGLHDAVDREIARVDAYVRAWCSESKEAQLLLTVPGVGPVVAASLLSQIGDVNRFPTPAKLCAYAGIVPRVHQSGMTRRNGRTSRVGRSLMRWALSIAVPHAARREGPLKTFRDRLAERRPKGVVHVACGRKLLTAIWYMLKRGVPFNAQDEALSAVKRQRLTARVH